jgi:hypothetical protein
MNNLNATSNWKFEAKLEGWSPCELFHACKKLVLTSKHVCLEVKFGFKKNIGNLSEGSIPVILISMVSSLCPTLS